MLGPAFSDSLETLAAMEVVCEMEVGDVGTLPVWEGVDGEVSVDGRELGGEAGMKTGESSEGKSSGGCLSIGGGMGGMMPGEPKLGWGSEDIVCARSLPLPKVRLLVDAKRTLLGGPEMVAIDECRWALDALTGVRGMSSSSSSSSSSSPSTSESVDWDDRGIEDDRALWNEEVDDVERVRA